VGKNALISPFSFYLWLVAAFLTLQFIGEIIMNSFKERRGEKVGGGFFVFRRGKKTGRVGIKTPLPFEHPDYDSAYKEATRMAKKHKGELFEVFQSTRVGVRQPKLSGD
jgi:hypothetical protein